MNDENRQPLGGWLRRTKQWWKMLVFVSMVFLGLGLLVNLIFAYQGENTEQSPSLSTSFGFVGVGVLTFAWIAIAISCRRCGRFVGWKIMRKAEAAGWIFDILYADSCPICGDRGD